MDRVDFLLFHLIFLFFSVQTSILDTRCFLIARYVLKKRFGRGSYGEVWLAFHWNCHEGDNSSRWSELTKNVSGESICEDMSIRNPCNSSSTDDFHGGYFHDSLFILKRIMVSILIVSFSLFLFFPFQAFNPISSNECILRTISLFLNSSLFFYLCWILSEYD